MNKFAAILYDSFLEIKSGKVIYLYAAVTLIMILIFALVPSMNINGENMFDSGLLSEQMVSGIFAHFFSGFFGFVIFLMVFGSAWLLPSYLSKGRSELILSKPIGRPALMLMKFTSVFLIKAAILALISTAIYIILAIRLGSFSIQYFYGLFIAFIILLIVYSIVFVIGILSRSGALALMGYFVVSIASGLLSNREMVYGFLGDSVWKKILDVTYHILPKFNDIDSNIISLMNGQGFVDGYAIYSSLGFSVVIYLIALLIFRRRDY